MRQQLFEAMTGPELELRVGGATVVAETPYAPMLDSVQSLVVVDVLADGLEVAGARVRGPSDVPGVLSSLATTNPVYLVRGEDSASMGLLADTLDTLRRAGAEHVVLGITRPSAALTSWDECPFPLSADTANVNEGYAVVVVDLDDAARAAVVRVLHSSGHGFAGAAALCVTRRRFDPGTAGTGKRPLRVRFIR